MELNIIQMHCPYSLKISLSLYLGLKKIPYKRKQKEEIKNGESVVWEFWVVSFWRSNEGFPLDNWTISFKWTE